MKILTISLLFLLGAFSMSGVSRCICSVNDTIEQPGLYPISDSIPCVTVGSCFDYTLQFVNFDSTTVSGIRVRVDYLIFDSIQNMPCGFEWVLENDDITADRHRLENQQHGCIRIGGTTTDLPGIYKVRFKFLTKLSLLPIETAYTGDELGIELYLRIMDAQASACSVVDTSAALLTASCSTNSTDCLCDAPCICYVGINEIASINSFSFYPNPTTDNATVSFTADKSAAYTTRIVNIYGQEVSREVLQVRPGVNTHPIDVSALPAGVYFFTITDGKNTTSQRFVVE
jgi:hypothetical protein